jgi:hypothetical protein
VGVLRGFCGLLMEVCGGYCRRRNSVSYTALDQFPFCLCVLWLRVRFPNSLPVSKVGGTKGFRNARCYLFRNSNFETLSPLFGVVTRMFRDSSRPPFQNTF